MNFRSFLIFFSIIFAMSCANDKTQNPVEPKVDLTLNFKTKINNSDATLGDYYELKDGDSLLISRLDFYIDEFQIGPGFSRDSPILYSMLKSSNNVRFSSNKIPTTFANLGFLVGLDSATNLGNPIAYPANDPLSSNANMWWTMSTNYRYIVFEGKVKLASGIEQAFSYHTGLRFKRSTSLSKNITLNAGSTNQINISLDLLKFFHPTNGSNIRYADGLELAAHGEAGQEELMNKLVTNFNSAFSIE